MPFQKKCVPLNSVIEPAHSYKKVKSYFPGSQTFRRLYVTFQS
nr:hypothetical protein [Klebsiella pneumoniae]QEQ70345.1 hypothetical protein [Klebsiella pneumoniae]UMW89581.1 hypothetical protein [Klebsiella pneumoniae]